MANTHDYGELVRLTAAFTDADGSAIDPNAVYVQVKDPAGNITTYQYNVDAEVVKDSVGNYHIDINANQAGIWHYRWYSTGTGQAAEEAWYKIDRSEFD